MSDLIALVKPDGTEIKVNQNSLEWALSLGWKKPTQKSKTNGNGRKSSK